jgi:hypothetical protein
LDEACDVGKEVKDDYFYDADDDNQLVFKLDMQFFGWVFAKHAM